MSELIAHKQCVLTACSTIIKLHCDISLADEIFPFWCGSLLWFGFFTCVWPHILHAREGCNQGDLCRFLERQHGKKKFLTANAEVSHGSNRGLQGTFHGWVTAVKQTQLSSCLPQGPTCASPSLLLRFMEASLSPTAVWCTLLNSIEVMLNSKTPFYSFDVKTAIKLSLCFIFNSSGRTE